MKTRTAANRNSGTNTMQNKPQTGTSAANSKTVRHNSAMDLREVKR